MNNEIKERLEDIVSRRLTIGGGYTAIDEYKKVLISMEDAYTLGVESVIKNMVSKEMLREKYKEIFNTLRFQTNHMYSEGVYDLINILEKI